MSALPAEFQGKWMTIPDARSRLGEVGRSTVYRLIENGLLKKEVYLGRAMVSVPSIEKYLQFHIRRAG